MKNLTSIKMKTEPFYSRVHDHMRQAGSSIIHSNSQTLLLILILFLYYAKIIVMKAETSFFDFACMENLPWTASQLIKFTMQAIHFTNWWRNKNGKTILKWQCTNCRTEKDNVDLITWHIASESIRQLVNKHTIQFLSRYLRSEMIQKADAGEYF